MPMCSFYRHAYSARAALLKCASMAKARDHIAARALIGSTCAGMMEHSFSYSRLPCEVTTFIKMDEMH